jgi:DNA-binding NarL/FixJ family response regulator
MDIAMPLLNGVDATRRIRRSVPETKILIYSLNCDDEYVQGLLQAGAVAVTVAGFLTIICASLLRYIRKAR